MPTRPRIAPLALLPALVLLLAMASGRLAPDDEVSPTDRPNILFLSVDDMSCDSVGAFGCALQGTTPHIDVLAAQGLRFHYAHVQVAGCMPSRNVMFSGRYPHNSRIEGFYAVRDPGYPVLADLMKGGGYFTAIRGKVRHSTPYSPYGWDMVLDKQNGREEHPRDVQSYYRSTRRGIEASKKAGKPFCLLVNVVDPHRPFYRAARRGNELPDLYLPSRVYNVSEVPVPGFLPDHPNVRRELARYYSSVRRADDCVGQVLRALDESGERERTFVLFLSDHGMPLPFVKTQVYHHSTRTPWIVRWPEVTRANTIDRQHMISAIDLLPTLLDVAGIEHPPGLEGRSIEPILRGETQSGREMIFKVYNENAGGGRRPMRSVQTKRFGYIFNPWSDGKRVFQTATTGTASHRTMQQLAATDADIAMRLELFDHRVREEFYDYESDPDALHNLIDDPRCQDDINRLRGELERWMASSKDPLLTVFRQRDDEAVVQAYMAQAEKESAERGRNRRKKR